jgi:hypothetical protein
MEMGTAAKTHDAGIRQSHRVDLPLDVAILNEQFMAIGLWLVEWQIPHEARIVANPRQKLLQVSFTDRRHARAFHLQFGGEDRFLLDCREHGEQMAPVASILQRA